MIPIAFSIGFFALSVILISFPAHSTTIYIWKDANGVSTFSDDPTNAPKRAQIEVFSDYSDQETVSETAETDAVQASERPSRIGTQGEFAVQLVQELGLGEASTEKEAADILTNIRIAPRLGRWDLGQPMTPGLAIRLRNLVIAAAETGRITLTPDKALLAFDTTAALLGVTISAPSGPKEPLPSLYPIAEAPPLVMMEQPPSDIYPYYVWVPVEGGFWYNDFLFPGFFALNVNGFFFRHHHHHFIYDRFIGLNPRHIGGHFRNHIIDHRLIRFPGISDSRVISRPLSGISSVPSYSGTFNLPARSRHGLHLPGLSSSLAQLQRRFSSPRPTIMSPMAGRQAFASHAFDHIPMAGPPLQKYSVPYNNTSTSILRRSVPSISHGFSGRGHEGGFRQAHSRGSSRPYY